MAAFWTRVKVDFFICGTQKGGTTALDAYLRQQPGIEMARRKEAHFFDEESHFLGDTVDYSAYHAFFDMDPQCQLRGEATPIYMYWDRAPARIKAYNPAAKIIVLLRNPIERAHSHWNMARSRGRETLSFRAAIHAEPERLARIAPRQHRVHSYVDRGRYSRQLQRLWDVFGREQVAVLASDALKCAPQATLDTIRGFLGLEGSIAVEPLTAHAIPYGSRMEDDDRRLLQALFEDEIRTLERLLDWDCSHWLA